MEDRNTPPHGQKERMMEMNDMVDLLEFGLSRMEKRLVQCSLAWMPFCYLVHATTELK